MPSRTALSKLLALAALASIPASAQEPPFLQHSRVDPYKVMTAEACGECHVSEYEVWKRTPHSTAFKSLHRKPQAETIARKMGFRLIKRDSLCFSCHYTPIVDGERIRVVSGVSCESCHGSGAGWIEVHNDYGAGETHGSESAEHRAERIERSRRAGMRRPSDLYPVVANCFSCHTVPDEELVNTGGHTSGSAGFEFVERSQGEIRHNFLASLRSGVAGSNRERPLERRRIMYVVGRALDLEYSLRGMAVARQEGVYSKAMARRVRSAVAEVRAIYRAASLPQVDAMLAAVKGVQVAPRNEAALLAAAEEVGAATQAFLNRNEVLEIADLDPLLLGTGEAEPDFDQVAERPRSPEAPATAGPRPAGDSSPASPLTTPAAVAGPSTGIVGTFKRRFRRASQHRTIGPGACAGCHGPQNTWWFGDPHYRSADPFFDGAADNRRIALLYGARLSETTSGRQLCMDCHGTIISGKESREVLDGVSCESCHGAAADWLEPHKDEGGKELGRSRPGHLKALKLGKLKLGDLGVRAEACAGCHYITEPRLISAGHPSGSDFDFVAGVSKIRHWSQEAVAGELRTAFARIKSKRGPVPDVPRAVLTEGSLPRPPEDPQTAVARRRTSGRRGLLSDPSPSRVPALRPPLPRPAAPGLSGRGRPGGRTLWPTLPAIDESTSIEEILLQLQERLKILYRAARRVDRGGSP